MTIDEIRESGMLELYALGQLSAREQEVVMQYLASYPALKKDLEEIERSLEKYAHAAGIKAPDTVKERILSEISDTAVRSGETPSPSRSLGWRIAAGIFAIVALGLLSLIIQKDRALREIKLRLTTVIDSCDQQNKQYLAENETLRQLTLQANEILHMTGTEKYPETDLYFYHNPVSKRNFIQVRNLPSINENQSYQLWSLKPDSAPIPLDVFQSPASPIIEVRHVDASQSYAITIEPRGGRQTPTLEDLIGIVQVSE